VYIMTNHSKTLYTGITNNLMRRVREHKTGTGSGFTAKYKLGRLVYFERFDEFATQSSARSASKAGYESRKSHSSLVAIHPKKI
jgi:putative endonuclease